MIKAIIFDFDGVIIDSYETTITYMQRTLAFFHKKVPSRKDFNNLLGLKTMDLLKNLLPPNTSKEEFNKIYEHSKKESLKSLSDIILIKDVKETLKKLSRQYQFGIASSRGKITLDLLLDKFCLRKYFKSIISRDDVTRHKPHPEAILKALKQLKIKTNNAIYIGDMPEDVLAAKAAKIPVIIIKNPWAGKLKTKYMVNQIKQIPQLLNEIR